MPFTVNTEMIADYLTFPDHRGETLLHFGDSWESNREVYEHRAKEIVGALAQRRYLCQMGKRSGDTGLVELLHVVEQTGFTEADLRPVAPGRLAQVLQQVTQYPVTQENVRFRDRDQIVICVDVQHHATGIDASLRAMILADVRAVIGNGMGGEDVVGFVVLTFADRADGESLAKLARELMHEVAPDTSHENGERDANDE